MGLTVDNFALTIGAVETPASAFDLSTPSYRFFQQFAMELANGSAADQANKLWTDERSVASGSPDDIDLSGTLAGVYGTVVFSRIVGIAVKHVSGAGDLSIGGSPTNPFIAWLIASGDGVKLLGGTNVQRPMFVITSPTTAGYVVTGASADVLRFASSSGTVVYRVIVIGS